MVKPNHKVEKQILGRYSSKCQGYIDDSGSELQGPLFVLGGFIATTTQWADFSDEWAAALGASPSLDYFKAKEAYRLRDQFDPKRGWDERRRDDRIAILVRIIKKHAIARVHASIRPADFRKYLKSLPLPSWIQHVLQNAPSRVLLVVNPVLPTDLAE